MKNSIAKLFRPLAVVAAMSLLASCTTLSSASPQQKASTLVEKSEKVFVDLWSSKEEPLQNLHTLWPHAKGIVILPGVLKGGFVVGAEGGSGVLLARDDTGRWGYPAFYTMAAGSVGWQAGGQSTDIIMLLFSDKAVNSIIHHQGKLGADLGLVVGTVGVGVEASTTTNIGADILAFSRGIGLFAGGSLEGAIMIKRNDFNEGYYATPVTPEQIIIDNSVENPHADNLRALLANAENRQ